ncbi:MAG: hypothetical protein L0Z62_01695 [Gemmataceae bacterium]|nr:hypothetical protein [Gemmataceae bacterium]
MAGRGQWRALGVLLLASAFCACLAHAGGGEGAGAKGTRVTRENADRLRVRVTSAGEARELLGDPDESKDGGKTLVWRSGDNSITITFDKAGATGRAQSVRLVFLQDVPPEGLYALDGRVVQVRAKDLLVAVEGPQGPPTDGKSLRLKTTATSRLTVFDARPGSGKAQTSSKPIQPRDLKPNQKVSVTFYSDGKELTLLSCVAAGPNLGGEGVLQHVAALGGRASKLTPSPLDRGLVRWEIDLSGSRAGDDDLPVIGRLADLESLKLAHTAVTDRGLKHLRPLLRLRTLDLTGTKVTDEAVAALRKLRALNSVSVANSGITGAGVKELLRGFPNLDLCRQATGRGGKFRVVEEFRDGKPREKRLMIGDTLYGVAYVRPPADAPRAVDRRRLATTYYHRHGPAGQMLGRFNWFPAPRGENVYHADARLPVSLVGLGAWSPLWPAGILAGVWSEPAVGVIRLNAGTHACYGRPWQHLDFYNSTPEIAVFSLPPKGQPRAFDFIHDALQRGCRVRVLEGDERATLARKGPRGFYSALFIDITREDLREVNTSLMTQEGMAELLGGLREDGVLCYHISHRFHDFAPPLADAAKQLGCVWKMARDRGNWELPPEVNESHFGSVWFMVARKAEYLQHLRDRGTVRWSVPEATGRHLWRDGRPHDLKPLQWRRD